MRIFPLAVALFFAFAVDAAPVDQQFIIQKERQKAFEAQITPQAPDIHLSVDGEEGIKTLSFPEETPCFSISKVNLSGAEEFPRWIPMNAYTKQATGKCLGGKGINILMKSLQNLLIEHGYVTTRVLAPGQDLKSGVLELAIIPGKVRDVKFTDDSDSRIALYTTFPQHNVELLDLRDIEQGLENFQRLPTVQADMQIVPAEKPGESDIFITRKQSRIWRVDLSLDDSGSQTT